jgi:hypothetical protein
LDNDEIISSLDRELAEYLAATDGVSMSSEDKKLTLWAANSKTLPNWSALVQKLLLLQPSSASTERVFSLLNNVFKGQQDSSLTVYLESSLMLRKNNAKRNSLAQMHLLYNQDVRNVARDCSLFSTY